MFSSFVEKLAAVLLAVMSLTTPGTVADRITCLSISTCRDALGEFDCANDNVECCPAPNGSLVLLQKPRGMKCCPGTGALYNVSYQACQDSEIVDLPPNIYQCGASKSYNESNDELCCVADTGESEVHHRQYSGLWKCCGKHYVNYNVQGCCNSKLYDRSEYCCVGLDLVNVSSPHCKPRECSAGRHCCNGREIEDTVGTICKGYHLYVRDSTDHTEICEFNDGRRKFRSFNEKKKICHSTLGPIPRDENDEWCGATRYDAEDSLCCNSELHVDKSAKTGWRCCPSSVRAYHNGDQTKCPGFKEKETIEKKICYKKSRKRIIRRMKNGANIIGLRVTKDKPGNSTHRRYRIKETVLLKGMISTKTRLVSTSLRTLLVPRSSCLGKLEKNKRYALVTKEKIGDRQKYVINAKSVILPQEELSMMDLLNL